MRTISSAEYQLLTAFCNKHGVKYYDLQVELNDHLANAIEAIWESQPEITFEQALERVYQGFGKTGFRAFVKSKEIACQRKANKMFWSSFKTMFQWPHAVLTILLVVLYTAMSFVMSSSELSFAIGVLSFLIILGDLIAIYFATSMRNQENQPLLATRILSFNFLTTIIPSVLLGTQADSLWDGQFKTISSFTQFVFIACIQIFSIIIIIASNQSNYQIIKQAKANYPKAYL